MNHAHNADYGLGLFDPLPTSYARLSDCGTYRYTLGRRWDDGPTATFVMLNPSTADASQDDPHQSPVRGRDRTGGRRHPDGAWSDQGRRSAPPALLAREC